MPALVLALAVGLLAITGCGSSSSEQRREADAAAAMGLRTANNLLLQHKKVALDHNRVALFTVTPDIGGWYSFRKMRTSPAYEAVRKALVAPPYECEVIAIPGEILPSEMLGGMEAATTNAGADRAVFVQLTQSGDAVLIDIGLRGEEPDVVLARVPIEPSKLTYVNPLALLVLVGLPLAFLGFTAYRHMTARGALQVELRQDPHASQQAFVLAIAPQPINATVSDPEAFFRQYKQLTSGDGVLRMPLTEPTGTGPTGTTWPQVSLKPGTWYAQLYGVYKLGDVTKVLDGSLHRAVTVVAGATATLSFDLAPGVVMLSIEVAGSKIGGLLAWLDRDRAAAVTTDAAGRARLAGTPGNHDLYIECDGVVVRRGVALTTGRDQTVQINIDRERTLAKSTIVGTSTHQLAGAGLGPVEAKIMAPVAAKTAQLPQAGELIFERFEILQLLGHGMGGPVFMAFDQRSQREVVLRLMPASARNDQFAYLSFVANVETLAQLRHPNIARVYQVASEGERVFLISAKIDGTPLQAFLDKRGALALPQALEITRQLATGLVALHAQNIYHRNLSPRDVFVTHDQQIQIADIGLQQLMDVVSHGNVAVRGDVEYLPPELLGGGHSFEARSDLYSLGCVLFAMLTGRPPFPARSAARDHTYADAPSLERAAPAGAALPKHVVEFVAMCLAKSPAQRPKSAAQVVAFLDRAIAKLQAPA